MEIKMKSTKKKSEKDNDVSGESETPKTANSPVDIVKKRLVGMPGSISARLGQILTTTKRASAEEKTKIRTMMVDVHDWVDAITQECDVTKKAKSQFGLSSVGDPDNDLPVSAQSGDLQ